MIIGCTSHHIFVNTIRIYDPPEMSPYIVEYLVMFRLHVFYVRVMFNVTKLHKITELPRVFDACIVKECPDSVPHGM